MMNVAFRAQSYRSESSCGDFIVYEGFSNGSECDDADLGWEGEEGLSTESRSNLSNMSDLG